MNNHECHICLVAYFHLHCIVRIRNILDNKTTEIMVHAYLTSHLNNVNCLLYGISEQLFVNCQICGGDKCCNISIITIQPVFCVASLATALISHYLPFSKICAYVRTYVRACVRACVRARARMSMWLCFGETNPSVIPRIRGGKTPQDRVQAARPDGTGGSEGVPHDGAEDVRHPEGDHLLRVLPLDTALHRLRTAGPQRLPPQDPALARVRRQRLRQSGVVAQDRLHEGTGGRVPTRCCGRAGSCVFRQRAICGLSRV